MRAFDSVFEVPTEAIIERAKQKRGDVYSLFDRLAVQLDARGFSPHSIGGDVNRVTQARAFTVAYALLFPTCEYLEAKSLSVSQYSSNMSES